MLGSRGGDGAGMCWPSRIPAKINYQAQSGRKHGLGTVGNGTDVGLFVHPVLAVDAQTQECLGLVDAQIWRRTKSKDGNYKRLAIEEKESYRWVKGWGASESRAGRSGHGHCDRRPRGRYLRKMGSPAGTNALTF